MINHPAKHTPALRFPEFTDNWQQTKADTYFENRRTKGKSELDIFAVTMRNGLVPRKNLERDHGPDADPESNLRIEPNDLVYNMMRMWQGAIGKTETTGMVSPAYVVLKPKQHTCPDFFLAFFKSRLGLYLLKSYSYGLTSDRLRLYFRDFAKIPVSVPSPQEQRKIASFLSAIDKRLEQLRKKRDLLETYKRGLMQKIFSQEIRFKADDGSDFPDWEISAISKISEPIKRKSEDLSLPVMTISSGKGFLLQEERFNQVQAGKSLENYTLLEPGNFSYNRGASKKFPYGCIYPLETKSTSLVPNVYRSFDLKTGVKNYYKQMFSFNLIDKQLRRIISSSARLNGLLNISEHDFYQIKIPLPTDKEQEKIADFLEKIDQKIRATHIQIYRNMKFKQSLIQQMFV